jgi:sugar phosphate isomerase/epimerase
MDASVRAGADVVALETCFMGSARDVDTAALTDQPCEVMLSWGHPHGIEYGTSAQSERDLLEWLGVAARCAHPTMRIVIGHWQVRDVANAWQQVRGTVPALRRLAASAARDGVVLAIENHTDVTAKQLAWLLDEVDSSSLGVCLDTANAVRIGDDLIEAASLLSSHVIAVHAKDISGDDWHPSSGPRSVALGTGVLPVEAVVREIAAARPECRFLVELAHLGYEDVDEDSLVAADIRWLRDLLVA